MSPEAAAEQGLYERLTDDAELAVLLGPGQRVLPGFPHDLLKAADCPRLTFYVSGPPAVAKGVLRVRATVDLWVWPVGVNGGRTRLFEIDERIVELFHEADFSFADHWLYSRTGGFRDLPSGPNAPLRRTRDILLDVAAQTAA